ncbi:MAG: hypothetical protein PF569_05125 [Candidatus Woesearchaeota archaeon]|jgi:hypothetical protein|nr:hypothetical protein [Candidatus Woesearchaeota archaeon]
MNKKALGAIVAAMLLLLVGVTMYIGLQNWYKTYQSDLQVEIIPQGSVEIVGLEGNILYIRNNANSEVEFNSIEINGIDCPLSVNLSASNINFVNISSCLSGMPDGQKDITVFSDSGIFKKTTYYVES